ncbi:MAG: dephospho-CoA kinase [Proteobacteria bacterium]|nr:dephospho-CoA kinase [Pseudomonadota bacterium]
MSLHEPRCVGLTGGIGCGKSTVARLFEAQGARIIDTDAIAHQLTQPGGLAIAAILAGFGADYLTPEGAMDRNKMRRRVFADRDAKSKLENILHPMILEISKIHINQYVTLSPYVILMAPLLLECPDFLKLVQRVLLVNCTEQHQISRVMQRSGIDESQIRAIIALQMPATERLARADDIIQNDGTIDDLENQISSLHQHYLNNNYLTAS